MCDFSEGFKEPEIVKNRPVLVISPAMKSRPGLVTVVSLSTTCPNTEESYHAQLPAKAMPKTAYFQGKVTWLKGDMLNVVGFHRLNLIKLNERHPTTNKRIYFKGCLSRDYMKQVYSCVLSSLNIGHVSPHL